MFALLPQRQISKTGVKKNPSCSQKYANIIDDTIKNYKVHTQGSSKQKQVSHISLG